MDNLVKLFCVVDDFWKKFKPEWKKHQLGQEVKKTRRPAGLSMSKLMTILILFQIVGFRHFKTFYLGYVLSHLKRDFPGVPSYTRFLELKKGVIFPMYCFLLNQMSACTGISYIDSTPSNWGQNWGQIGVTNCMTFLFARSIAVCRKGLHS